MKTAFSSCKTLFALLLAGLLAWQAMPARAQAQDFPCGPPTASAGNARAVEEIFGQSVPTGWAVIRSDTVSRAGEQGLVLMIQNGPTMALIVRTERLGPEDPLADRNMARAAYHLFESYIFGRPGFRITGFKNAAMAVNGVRVATTWMRVEFSDGYVEPDLLARFRRGGHLYLVLLGQPRAGEQGVKKLPVEPYIQMQRSLRGIVQATETGQNR